MEESLAWDFSGRANQIPRSFESYVACTMRRLVGGLQFQVDCVGWTSVPRSVITALPSAPPHTPAAEGLGVCRLEGLGLKPAEQRNGVTSLQMNAGDLGDTQGGGVWLTSLPGGGASRVLVFSRVRGRRGTRPSFSGEIFLMLLHFAHCRQHFFRQALMISLTPTCKP